MKRKNNLIEHIADFDNLRLAFWKAQRAHSAKEEVVRFRQHLERNLSELHKEILEVEVEVGKYHYFTIYDPKERTICAASFRERVLHHALMNVCHEASPGKGIPIGNLTSQYFANHYLAAADHYVKEQLAQSAYIRYMDDMVLWGNCKAGLLGAGRSLEAFIAEKLHLELKPFCLNHVQRGLPFLGYTLYPYKTFLSHNSRRRFSTKLTKYNRLLNNGIWSQLEYQRHVLPLLAFTGHTTKSIHLPLR
jgi:hypothetical protein